MRFLIVSNAPLVYENGIAKAYAPYIKEMAIWHENVTETAFCCPVWPAANGLLVTEVPFPFRHFRLKDFNFKTPKAICYALFQVPYNVIILFRAMCWANHIHLRCPGNAGLIGALIQIFFPGKKKTAKYAGNWDTSVPKPLSYRLQQHLLANTFLTRNMAVLVYGNWAGAGKNIKPFFTASYSKKQITSFTKEDFEGPVRFVFAGMLTPGKGVIYALKIVHALRQRGHNISLELYGEGVERAAVEKYIAEHELQEFMHVFGNQNDRVLIDAYQRSHFVILPSASEGWPKVIAEGMFWGCVPIATPVSCVPDMLDSGKRGLLLKMQPHTDTANIEALINDYRGWLVKSSEAANWSQHFTTELFAEEISKLVRQ
ncbi:glycosyl transferase [Flavobacterium magnum]|uniref:Glycosyl transferase n=1 Tax=Flavobacterium magnum TaxID=2162713 RepID=A0A2S0RDH2_9FLAO|nr:glycosyltransferase [Flavobacterium magnum]AWA29793.1 glycosyl transferase [Flavobacterium magnum]